MPREKHYAGSARFLDQYAKTYAEIPVFSSLPRATPSMLNSWRKASYDWFHVSEVIDELNSEYYDNKIIEAAAVAEGAVEFITTAATATKLGHCECYEG